MPKKHHKSTCPKKKCNDDSLADISSSHYRYAAESSSSKDDCHDESNTTTSYSSQDKSIKNCDDSEESDRKKVLNSDVCTKELRKQIECALGKVITIGLKESTFGSISFIDALVLKVTHGTVLLRTHRSSGAFQTLIPLCNIAFVETAESGAAPPQPEPANFLLCGGPTCPRL